MGYQCGMDQEGGETIKQGSKVLGGGPREYTAQNFKVGNSESPQYL